MQFLLCSLYIRIDIRNKFVDLNEFDRYCVYDPEIERAIN